MYAQAEGERHPEASQGFRTRLENRVKATGGRTLTEWLDVGRKTQQRIQRWSAVIHQKWACGPMDILSNQYASDKPLSVEILKGLAELSALKSLDEGRGLLNKAIESRQMRTTGRHSYMLHLTHQDITRAEKEARQGSSDAHAVREATPILSPSLERTLVGTPGCPGDEAPGPIQGSLLDRGWTATLRWPRNLLLPKDQQSASGL